MAAAAATHAATVRACSPYTRRGAATGLGKPEPLKGKFAGWRSRRINREHRLVYRVRGAGGEQTLEIAQCHYHY